MRKAGRSIRRQQSSWLNAWKAFSKAATKRSKQVQKVVGKAIGEVVVAQTSEAHRSAKRVITGVASPATIKRNSSGGRWEEGRWGLGPLMMRKFRLYIPSGVSISNPAPLLVMLHGCGQDAASFAACTRVAAIARAERCVVLLPEQSSHANPHRCWNWFRAEARASTETMLLMTIIDYVCSRQLVRLDQIYALGISAGGTMALMLALRFPERFAAVGTHSGAAPHSARNVLQAAQTMRGHRDPDTEKLRLELAGRPLPPLIVLHGNADHVVAFDNGVASTALWLDLYPGNPPTPGDVRNIQRGARRSYTIVDWKRGRRPYVRLVNIAGLGHAWSGGAPKQAYSDPTGPDAIKLAFRFFRDSTAIPRLARNRR
ncbi:MAG: alpha/beta fold hydrolase [Pseudomonadota bacterium]